VGTPSDARRLSSGEMNSHEEHDAAGAVAVQSSPADGTAMKDLTQTQPAMSQIPLPEFDQDVHATLMQLNGGGKKYDLRRGIKEVVIGRHPECFVHIDNCKMVSGKHLRIYWDDAGNYYVQALGSNHTYIDSTLMSQNHVRQLQHGCTISLVQYYDPTVSAAQADAFPAFHFKVVSHCDHRDTAMPGLKSAASPRHDESNEDRMRTEDWVREHWDMKVVLGSGNFSQVRLGVKVETGGRYAVKVIEKKKFYQFQNKRDTKLSLTSEAAVLEKLHHEGIVRCHDWFETDTYLFLVMELMEAGDLLQCILESGCFSETQAKRLYKELCEAVAYLHEHDVVHRDLKPENILLTNKNRDFMSLKVTDFGLARSGAHSSQTCRTFCGTPHYFAPEVIRTCRQREGGGAQPEASGYGKPADMWSLGVILYIMLCGSPPFEEDGLYEQILEGKYEFDVPEWQGVTQEAKDLVQKLMTINPKERLTIQQVLNHPWFRVSGDSATTGLSQQMMEARELADPDAYKKALKNNPSESSTTTASSCRKRRPEVEADSRANKMRRSTQDGLERTAMLCDPVS